jgi:hypothetical protein
VLIVFSLEDAPRTLRSPEACSHRKLMLSEPHVAPLAQYVERMRLANPDWQFPDFDPLDGGVEAELLFLLEKPGPMTSPTGKRAGSGFISRNNDDPTAENVYNFMLQAGIPRKKTALWNVMPGWNSKIQFTRSELRNGIEHLREVLPLLPKVTTVVLVGSQARKALPLLQALGMHVFESAHPGQQVYRFNPTMWRSIPDQWREAWRAHQA